MMVLAVMFNTQIIILSMTIGIGQSSLAEQIKLNKSNPILLMCVAMVEEKEILPNHKQCGDGSI